MTVIDILNELASNNSKIFKLEYLEKHKNNEDLKEFFRLTLDKQLNFYVKKIPTYDTKHLSDLSLSDAMKLTRKLSNRVFTGKKALIFISKTLTRLSSEDAEAFIRLIKRDPACGISHTTVNKIWPGLIHIWPCHLCERSTEKNLANINYPAISQEKADGMRINLIYEDGVVLAKSRNGKFINLYGQLDDEVKKFHKYMKCNYIIDGEALVIDLDGNLMERKAGNGIMNKAIQNTISKEEASRVIIKIWDIIPLDAFYDRKGVEPYITTIKKIKFILDHESFSKIDMIRTVIVKDRSEALKFYNQMIEKNLEGAILKNFNSIWEDKRSKNSVKLKIEEDVELEVIDWYKHKKKNQIGGLVCQSSDGQVIVNVGSGLKDIDRKKDPVYYISKIVTVRSNGLIDAENKDSWSLFLPRFPANFVRFDKDTAQNYEDIKACFDIFLKKEK